MKKSKLSVVALVISLLPFITLLISLFSEKITGGLQMGLTALNVISILLGLYHLPLRTLHNNSL